MSVYHTEAGGLRPESSLQALTHTHRNTAPLVSWTYSAGCQRIYPALQACGEDCCQGPEDACRLPHELGRNGLSRDAAAGCKDERESSSSLLHTAVQGAGAAPWPWHHAAASLCSDSNTYNSAAVDTTAQPPGLTRRSAAAWSRRPRSTATCSLRVPRCSTCRPRRRSATFCRPRSAPPGRRASSSNRLPHTRRSAGRW